MSTQGARAVILFRVRTQVVGLSSHWHEGCLYDRQVASFALSRHSSLLTAYICLPGSEGNMNISAHRSNVYFVNISAVLSVLFTLWTAKACAFSTGSFWAILDECQQNKIHLSEIFWCENIFYTWCFSTPGRHPSQGRDTDTKWLLVSNGPSGARLPDRSVHMTRPNQFNLLSFCGGFLVETSRGEPNRGSSFYNHIVLLWGRDWEETVIPSTAGARR